MEDTKRIVTGVVRLSYVHLLRPHTNNAQQGAEAKYSVTLLIPKQDVATLQRIQQAIEVARVDALNGVWKGVQPPNLTVPLHDGDGQKQNGEPFGPECKGHWVMTASTKNKPEVIDANKNPIIDETQIYSGCYGHVSIRFFGYFSNGKKGIGAGLGNVMKVRDGEPLGGYVSAEDDFGSIASTSYAAPNGGNFAAPVQNGYTPNAYQAQVQQPQQYQTTPPQYYQAPIQQPQQNYGGYQPPMQQSAPVYPNPGQLDPITGQPIGGIMGLGK